MLTEFPRYSAISRGVALVGLILFMAGLIMLIFPSSAYVNVEPSGESFINCGSGLWPSVDPIERGTIVACAAVNDGRQVAGAWALLASSSVLLIERVAAARKARRAMSQEGGGRSTTTA